MKQWLSRHDDGRHFMTGQKGHMAPKHWKQPRSVGSQRSVLSLRSRTSQRSVGNPISLSALEQHAAKHEKELLMNEPEKLKKQGYKGWTVGIAYMDGTEEYVELIAKTWEQALDQAKGKMKHIHTRAVDKIVIEDPDLGWVYKRAKAAARIATGYMKKGLDVTKKVAHGLGQVVSAPAQVREAYRAGVEERPEAPEYAYHKPSAGEMTSRMRANIARDRLSQARAEEELQRIEERRRILHRRGYL